jgi:hypothetical protein
MIHRYHRCFAWLPTRLSCGQRVWLCHYYLRPGPNGLGVLVSAKDAQQGL